MPDIVPLKNKQTITTTKRSKQTKNNFSQKNILQPDWKSDLEIIYQLGIC